MSREDARAAIVNELRAKSLEAKHKSIEYKHIPLWGEEYRELAAEYATAVKILESDGW